MSTFDKFNQVQIVNHLQKGHGLKVQSDINDNNIFKKCSFWRDTCFIINLYSGKNTKTIHAYKARSTLDPWMRNKLGGLRHRTEQKIDLFQCLFVYNDNKNVWSFINH